MDLLIPTGVCILGGILVTLIYYKVAKRADFAALAQVWATLVLVAVTWVYVNEIRRGSDLPWIGVVDIKVQRVLKDQAVDNYDSTIGAHIHFVIKNTGSQPAKNIAIKVTGKIGNTTLPFTESEKGDGSVMFPGTVAVNSASLSKATLDKLVLGEQKLTYTLEFHYTDWGKRTSHRYTQVFQVKVVQKDPLNLALHFPVSA